MGAICTRKIMKVQKEIKKMKIRKKTVRSIYFNLNVFFQKETSTVV